MQGAIFIFKFRFPVSNKRGTVVLNHQKLENNNPASGTENITKTVEKAFNYDVKKYSKTSVNIFEIRLIVC